MVFCCEPLQESWKVCRSGICYPQRSPFSCLYNGSYQDSFKPMLMYQCEQQNNGVQALDIAGNSPLTATNGWALSGRLHRIILCRTLRVPRQRYSGEFQWCVRRRMSKKIYSFLDSEERANHKARWAMVFQCDCATDLVFNRLCQISKGLARVLLKGVFQKFW